jgi:hypothetical protein
VTEVGHIETFQSAYDGTWTVDVDSDQYRNIRWSILASGAAHPGLRIPGAALADTGPLLPQEMRDTHKALRSVLDGSGIDFSNHSQANWDHNISFSANGQTVSSTGSFAGEVGLVYLMQDLRDAGGTVSSGSLTVSELGVADSTELTVSFWDPADVSVALVVVSASSSEDDLAVSVPDFQNGLLTGSTIILAFLADVIFAPALMAVVLPSKQGEEFT